VLSGELVDIGSKNGALLLNIGPRPDGSIPQEDVQRLEAIGAWLAVNGEAIYRIRPWKIFGEGPSGIVAGHCTDTHRAPYTSTDIRFTHRGTERIHDDILCATAMAWPEDDRGLIWSLGSGSWPLTQGILRIDLLGGPKGLVFQCVPDGLQVTLPGVRTAEHSLVLRLYLDPPARLRRLVDPTQEHGPSHDA
jgi:alpha-L-fucosidase